MITNSNLLDLLKAFLSSGSAASNSVILKQQLEAIIDVFNDRS